MELSSPKLEKLLIYQEQIFQAQKTKKAAPKEFLIFFRKNYFAILILLAPSLKNSFIFSEKKFLMLHEGTCKA